MSKTLETLDDLVFVLGEDSSEAISIHNHLIQRRMLPTRSGSVFQNLSGVHVIAQTETPSSLFCNSKLVTSYHLYLNTESEGIIDGLLGILTRGIEDSEETNELKSISFFLGIVSFYLFVRNSERTKTTGGVLLNIRLKSVLELFGLVAGAEFDDDTGHTLRDTLNLARRFLTVSDLCTLVDRVKRLEIKKLDASTGAADITDGLNNGLVNGILVLGT